MTSPTHRLRATLRERRRLARQQAGYAAIFMALLVAGILFPIASFAVDVARWYVEGERVQAAADAAAMAGVTYLPADFSSASAEAVKVAGKNGYPNSGSSTVAVAQGAKPTQLQVTITSQVHNSIAASWGDDYTTISRTAVADYNGPAPMGSPCNTFGNEPAGTATYGPSASQLSVPSGATCSSTPQFWGSVYGPDIYKVDGDQVMTRYCSGSESNCTSGNNADFRPEGYFYIIRVGTGAIGKAVTVQLYDPAYVYTGQYCDSKPGTPSSNTINPYVTDAKTRYNTSATANSFCNGDSSYTAKSGITTATTTSYGLRAPVDTFVPSDAPPMSGCVKQYPGYASSAVSVNALTSTNGAYSQKLAAVFHQWQTLCTFTPASAGDYYLQVRTNVALNTSSYDNRGGYDGNMNVFTQKTDNTTVKGAGGNTFAIRAFATGASNAISVAGWDRMGMWMNTTGSSATFNLVRVVPAAATKTLDFEFFDGGDAASGGSFQILPPTETPITLTGCQGTGVVTGSLSNCKLTGVSSSAGYNGKSQHIRVPIPATYTCNWASAGGCWFRITVNFGTASVHDTTTWTARIDGDPVRLIK